MAVSRSKLSHFGQEESLTLNLTGSGDFTAGTVYLRRQGKLVTLEIGEDLAWTGSQVNLTSGAIIPAHLRPERGVKMVARITATPSSSSHSLIISSTGTIFIEFRNSSFALLSLSSPLVDSINGAVLTYEIP